MLDALDDETNGMCPIIGSGRDDVHTAGVYIYIYTRVFNSAYPEATVVRRGGGWCSLPRLFPVSLSLFPVASRRPTPPFACLSICACVVSVYSSAYLICRLCAARACVYEFTLDSETAAAAAARGNWRGHKIFI